MRVHILLLVLLLAGIAFCEFKLEEARVTIHDIKPDGSAQVTENIKLMIIGDSSQTDYTAGFSSNDIGFWTARSGLAELKYHVNPSKVAISELRVRPQPLRQCNPLQGVCHGELIIEYHATPLYNVSTNQPIPGTGLFKIEQPKPRTVRYTLLPSSLAFRTTPNDDILLEDNIFLTIVPPEDGVATDLNPLPENFNGTLPARLKQYTWSDAILVKFSVVFQVEEALEAEVTAFFQGLFGSLQSMLTGPYGIALIGILVIIIGGYAYISHEKRGAA